MPMTAGWDGIIQRILTRPIDPAATVMRNQRDIAQALNKTTEDVPRHSTKLLGRTVESVPVGFAMTPDCKRQSADSD
jgi:hypothetical protein